MFDALFWWMADAFNQKETKGCLNEFMWIFGLMALLALLGHLAYWYWFK